MNAPAGSILPASYFDGLSQLWGGAAYLAATIAAAGFVFSAATTRQHPLALIPLIVKVFFVGLTTVFLREWLMRLGDVVHLFGEFFRIDPTQVDEKFFQFISGTTPNQSNTSVWDVIWSTHSFGTALAYSLLWLFGWLAYAVQFVVKLVGDILLSAGWALSPVFLSLFMLRVMSGVATKYVVGLVAIVCWPFGWVIASVVTNAILDVTATASLMPVVTPDGIGIAPVLTVLLVGLWMIVSSILAPFVTYRVLTSGANPAVAFAQGVGGVMQAAFAGGVGAATATVTGGGSVGAVIAAAGLGTLAGGSESAARGGGSARTTSTLIGGMAGLYKGGFMRAQTVAMEEMAAAETRNANATEQFAAEFSERMRQNRNEQSDSSEQPHHPNPNQAAIDIEAYVKK